LFLFLDHESFFRLSYPFVARYQLLLEPNCTGGARGGQKTFAHKISLLLRAVGVESFSVKSYKGDTEMKTCFATLIFVMIATSGDVRAYPEPAVVQGAGGWTLGVVFNQPQQISVKCPGESSPKRYWYIVLTLTNRTGSDVPFYPACHLMTDTFQIVPAGKGVRQPVFDQIKFKHQGRYPFLENIDLADNNILEGVDNAKDIVVIWPDFDPKAKTITIFISGLSNETVAIDHPTAKDEAGSPVKVYLQKTLALEYAVGADQELRALATLSYKGKRWVMR
jgi:hypothetical protein